ncbi:MAG: histidine phosphatase family protein [Planctomycetota bacterium]|nr:histidine phosphatase family protein [Planctomycetota bacterium]
MDRRELLVLRHAHAAGGAHVDSERPLSAQGSRQARVAAAWIAELAPDFVLASPARRAAQTATIVASTEAIEFDERLYDATLATLLAVVLGSRGAEAGRTLVVAHNPGLTELVMHLTGEVRGLGTACLARIELPGEWTLAAGSGRLLEWRAP